MFTSPLIDKLSAIGSISTLQQGVFVLWRWPQEQWCYKEPKSVCLRLAEISGTYWLHCGLKSLYFAKEHVDDPKRLWQRKNLDSWSQRFFFFWKSMMPLNDLENSVESAQNYMSELVNYLRGAETTVTKGTISYTLRHHEVKYCNALRCPTLKKTLLSRPIWIQFIFVLSKILTKVAS